MNQEMLDKVRNENGFIAALDQSGGSSPKALGLYGIDESQYSGDDEMFDLIHGMRARICTSDSFDGDRVEQAGGIDPLSEPGDLHQPHDGRVAVGDQQPGGVRATVDGRVQRSAHAVDPPERALRTGTSRRRPSTHRPTGSSPPARWCA